MQDVKILRADDISAPLQIDSACNGESRGIKLDFVEYENPSHRPSGIHEVES